MQNVNLLEQQFIKTCRQHNLKITPQRNAIYTHLLDAHDHPSADKIFQEIKSTFPHISFDTVNRTLLTFSKIGLVNIVESFSSVRRFDKNLEHHHHIHCIKCGKILDYYCEALNQLKTPKEVEDTYKIINKRVVINVICDLCKKEE